MKIGDIQLASTKVSLRMRAEGYNPNRYPHLLHVIPASNDAVLEGVLQGKDTSLTQSLVTDVGVLLCHTDHHALVAGAAYDGREDGAGIVVTGKADLACAGAIVYYHRLHHKNILVVHFEYGRVWLKRSGKKVSLR